MLFVGSELVWRLVVAWHEIWSHISVWHTAAQNHMSHSNEERRAELSSFETDIRVSLSDLFFVEASLGLCQVNFHGNIFFDDCPFGVNVQFNITKCDSNIAFSFHFRPVWTDPGCSRLRCRPSFLLQSGSYLCITVILPEYKIVGFRVSGNSWWKFLYFYYAKSLSLRQ